MIGFGQMIGYEKTIEQLRNAIRGEKVSHAYIIEGPKGAGKLTLAKAFAAALQCETEGEDACGECHSCKQMATENHPDVITIQATKKNYSVDDIREQLVADIAVKPYNGRKKIYLIPHAETLNQQSQNALLKTIEEPPQYGVIFFLTENASTLLPTIRSRCVQINLHPLSDERVKNYLIHTRHLPESRATLCAAFAQGVLGKALLLAESEEFMQVREEMTMLLHRINDMPSYDFAAEARKIKEYQMGIEEYLELMRLWFRDLLLFKSTGRETQLVFKDEIPEIRRQAEKCSFQGIDKILGALEMTKTRQKYNVNFEMAMEELFAEIKENLK